MKISVIIFIFLLNNLSLYQDELDCSCEKNEAIEENKYDCDVLEFKNGSKLYWQFNCDSTWLTFENMNKLVLKSCEDETVYGCQKTGLNFLKEYPSYLLFEYNWLSGCCQPPDVVFISKDNGKEIDRIDRFQFVWGDIDENYLLYFSDTTYTELIFLDHITDERVLFEFKPGVVLTSGKENNVLRTNSLFKDFILKKSEFLFSFRLLDGSWENKSISLD